MAKEGNIALIGAVITVMLWQSAAAWKRGKILNKQGEENKSVLGAYSKEKIQYALCLGLCTFALVLAYRLVAPKLFGINVLTKTIYQDQYPGFSLYHILQTLGGLLIYLLFIPVGFGLFPLLVPLSQVKSYPKEGQLLLGLCVIATGFQVLGVSYLIFSHEMYDGIAHSRIHLRYVFYFFPIFFAAFISSKATARGINKTFVIMGLVWVALLITLGLGVYTSGATYLVDAPLLSFLDLENAIFDIRTLAQLYYLIAIGLVAYLLLKKGWTKKAIVIISSAIVLQLIVSNISIYNMDTYQPSITMRDDAIEVAQKINGTNTLMVSQEQNGWFDNGLNAVDTALMAPLPVASLEDVISQMGNDEIYVPPYWVAGSGNKVLSPQYILLKTNALYTLLPREDVIQSQTSGGMYTLLEVPEDGVWLHSGAAGIHYSMRITKESGIWIFDPDILQAQEVKLSVQANSYNEGTLVIAYNDKEQSYRLDTQNLFYDFTFTPAEGKFVKIDLDSVDEAYFTTYTLEIIR